MKRRQFVKRSLLATAGLGISLSSMGRILTRAERALLAENHLRSIGDIIPAVRSQVAPTLSVMRTLPIGRNVVIDPFILLDHFGPVHVKPGQGIGVGAHPHRGFEPVTFLFDGHVEHKDSLGNIGRLDGGGIQWMTSGKGIIHAEDMANRFTGDGGILHGVQLWVNLPKDKKMVKPGYQQFNAHEIPEYTFNNGKVHAKLAAGEIFGQKGPTSTFTPIIAAMISMAPDQKIEIPVPVHYNCFFQLLSGAIVINGRSISGSHLIRYNNDGSHAYIETDAQASGKTELLFLAGEPINEPVVQYGPFVMNSQAEIIQAFKDYEAGKMGSIDF